MVLLKPLGQKLVIYSVHNRSSKFHGKIIFCPFSSELRNRPIFAYKANGSKEASVSIEFRQSQKNVFIKALFVFVPKKGNVLQTVEKVVNFNDKSL